MKLDKIDLDNKSAYIQNSLDKMNLEDAERLQKEGKVVWFGRKAHGGKTVLALDPLKTDESEGYVPLPDIAIQAIEHETKQKKRQRLKFGVAYKDFGFLWTTDDGNPQDPDHLYHAFRLLIPNHNKRIEADNELTDDQKKEQTLLMIRPHDMRHTHATIFLRKKVDIKIVSKKIRHKRSSFTQDYYQQVANDMQSEMATAMDELFTVTKAKKPGKSTSKKPG